MPATLNNVTTADGYTADATAEYEGTVGLALTVANAAIFAEFDSSEDARGVWSGEEFYAPTMGWLPRKCSGVRFRSALASKPAQVSCQLYNEDEATGVGNLAPYTQTVSGGGEIGKGDFVKGTVNADGSVAAGSGFTVNKTGTGVYIVTFNPALPAPPAVIPVAIGSANHARPAAIATAASVQIETRTVGGSLVDNTFSFIAQG